MNYLKVFRREVKAIIESGDIYAAVEFAAEMILGDILHCIPSASIRWHDFGP
jgi:hypothetical protein